MLALSASTAGARKGWLHRYVKPYAWRFTGVYFWITALGAIFGFYDGVVNLERSLLDGLVVALRSIGFKPVNANYLDGVIRVLWVLIITAARPRDLLGLSLYVLTFPVWVFGLYLLKLFLRFYSQYKPMEPLTRPESYTVQDRPFRPLALCTALLGAWFILYGGAAEWQQIVPGIILSGIILLLLALRLFSRVRPTVGDGVGRLGWLVRSLERGTTRFMNESETEEEHYHQGTVIGELAVLRFHRRLAFHVAMLLRGPRAQERITMLVFAEYIISLIMVAASAVLFWALVISVAGPDPVPLFDSVRRSAAYFFPGIEPSSVGVRLPYWAIIGPAATGWILFVLYIGPAGSVLPERQRAASVEVTNAYRVFRHHIVVLGHAARRRERALAALPKSNTL
jgi:hypothetical protein